MRAAGLVSVACRPPLLHSCSVSPMARRARMYLSSRVGGRGLGVGGGGRLVESLFVRVVCCLFSSFLALPIFDSTACLKMSAACLYVESYLILFYIYPSPPLSLSVSLSARCFHTRTLSDFVLRAVAKRIFDICTTISQRDVLSTVGLWIGRPVYSPLRHSLCITAKRKCVL